MTSFSLVDELIDLVRLGKSEEIDELLLALETAVLKSSSQIAQEIVKELSQSISEYSGQYLTRVLQILFASQEKLESADLLTISHIAKRDSLAKNQSYAKALLARQSRDKEEPLLFLLTKDINLAAQVVDMVSPMTNLRIPHLDNFKAQISKGCDQDLIIDGLSMKSREYDELFWILNHREFEILPEPDPFLSQLKTPSEYSFTNLVLINDGTSYTANKIQRLKKVVPDLIVVKRTHKDELKKIIQEIEYQRDEAELLTN